MLVAVPFRHQIAYRIVDGPEALPAIGELAQFAIAGHSDSVGALSPHVCWVRGGAWRQLTTIEDRTVTVSIDEDVSAALGLDG